MKWYLNVWKKYAVFKGRARREEFWFDVLFNILIYLILGAISFFGQINTTFGSLYHTIFGASHHTSAMIGSVVVIIDRLIKIYTLAVLIPSIAVTARRLHDIGRSGWWQLIVLVPLVGPIVLFVFLTTDSQPGENQYGANPKAIET